MQSGSSISVHSPVFSWVVEHAADLLNKCHVASAGKSAYERLKKRAHRGELLPLGAAVMFRVAGEGSRWCDDGKMAPWLGKRFHTEEHIVVRKGDGLVIRSRAVKFVPEVPTSEGLPLEF